MYDLIIIGAGPAGITAAIYAARQKIKFLLLSLDIGGQTSWSSNVENYPGMHFLSGTELVSKFNEHMKDYNIKTRIEEVLDIKKQKTKTFFVKTNKATYESKTVMIASGKKPKKLNVPGEKEFLGKGVGYCATCDAPLFKEKSVAVIGGGNSALDSALFISKYAKKVFIIDINKKLGGVPILREKVIANKKIQIISNAKTTLILGNKFVKGLNYVVDGKEKSLKVEGVFIEIGLVSIGQFIKNVKKNKWGEIMIFRSTITNEENMTSVPGIFAAGDVTDIPAKQIVVAAGEGCKAALAAFDYLNRFKTR